MDDNEDIIEAAKVWFPFEDALRLRLDVGVVTYGHGVRVNDDTTQWGTDVNSWLEMGLEEIDDLAIYVIAQMIREIRTLPLLQENNTEEEQKSRKRALDQIRLKTFLAVLEKLKGVREDIEILMDNNG